MKKSSDTAAMKPESVSVKYRTVTLTVFPWSPRPGVTYWKFRHGKKHIVRSTLDKAKDEAKRIAEETYLGSARLGLLSTAQTRGIRTMLDADPDLSTLPEFLAWRAKQAPRHALTEARSEFLAIKSANAGTSPHHVRTLKRHLATLPAMMLADIGPADLPPLVGAPRSRKNRLNAWRSFFSWCRARGYLPTRETVIDRMDSPIIHATTPSTWTPAELTILFAHVHADYLPWLALSAWAGLRTEEICPDSKSGKSPLSWQDFQWDRGILIVRAETAKTGRRRIIPILPCLADILPHDRVGIVGPGLPPHTPAKGGVMAETTRLGKLVGGWRRNALRHSFISYRAAQVGIAQAAQEAGNSEAIARRQYQEAMGADTAANWFLIPQKYPSKSDRQISPSLKTS
jgi:integrase